MTLSTSAVAVCCCSASESSSVRACTSSNSRTFSIAMTAWSAKVLTSSICLSLNGRTSCRNSECPDQVALLEHRHDEKRRMPPSSTPVTTSGSLRHKLGLPIDLRHGPPPWSSPCGQRRMSDAAGVRACDARGARAACCAPRQFERPLHHVGTGCRNWPHKAAPHSPAWYRRQVAVHRASLRSPAARQRSPFAAPAPPKARVCAR